MTERNRDQILADAMAGREPAFVDAPPPPPTPPATGGNGDPFEPAPYKADADETVKCPNCEKMNDLDASFCDQCGAKLAGSTDVEVATTPEPQSAAPDAPPAPPAAAGTETTALADALPPPPPPAPTGDSVAEDADEISDATVSAKIDSALSAVQDALKTQGTDADSPLDAKVQSGLEMAEAALKKVQADQTTDSTTDPDTPPPPPPVTAAGAAAPGAGGPPSETPGNATGVPGDGDDSPPSPGDIEATLICANPDCGHPASLHADTTEGDNTGPCSDPNDDCPGMVPPANPVNTANNDEADSTPDGGVIGGGTRGQGDQKGQGQRDVAALADGDILPPVPAAEPAPVAAAPPASGDALPTPDPLPTETTPIGPPFCIPVGVIEGMPTGDGRGISEGALDWLDPPMVLMGLFTATHDPSGFDPNAPADIIGRIDSVTRRPDDNGVLQANGHLLTTEAGLEAAQIIEQMGRVPVSADIGGRAGRPLETESVLDSIMPELPPGVVVLDDGTGDVDDAMPEVLETLTQGSVLGFTVVPHAAFEDCFIVLGDGSDQPPIGELVNRTPAPAEGAPEGAEPEPVTASMDYRLAHLEECEPCAGAAPILASAAGGPLAPPRAWFDDPGFFAGDPRLRETTDDRVGRLTGKYACPPTITEDGQVFMHLAQWGVCHTSPQYKGQCMLAPRNHSGYSQWYQGPTVLTAEGDLVEIGSITIGTGHANPKFGMVDTLAHYDHTGTAVAYGRVGEDDFGIWFAGALSPDATPEQVYKLRASVPSGDWRPRGSRHELAACLMVNRGGFPQAKAHRVGGRMTSLVAAGAPVFAEPVVLEPLTLEERMAIMEGATAPLLPLAKQALNARMDALRA